jgi:hypothetical protein
LRLIRATGRTCEIQPLRADATAIQPWQIRATNAETEFRQIRATLGQTRELYLNPGNQVSDNISHSITHEVISSPRPLGRLGYRGRPDTPDQPLRNVSVCPAVRAGVVGRRLAPE